MPSGIPVATMAVDGAQNAAIFACQILAIAYPEIHAKVVAHKAKLAEKVAKANQELAEKEFKFRVK